MLSIFPELLFLAPVAVTLIRVTLALFLALSAYRHLMDTSTVARSLALFEALAAVALLAGYRVQAAAILGIVVVAIMLARSRLRTYAMSTLVLLGIISASLVVMGAGAFAFDLPL